MRKLLSILAIFVMAITSVNAKGAIHDEDAYKTLVSIIGTDKYCAVDDAMNAKVTYYIYVKDGEITLVSSYLTANATTLSSLQSDGKTYEFGEPEDIRFIVENNKISHIYVIDEDDNSISAEFVKDNSVEIPHVVDFNDIIKAMNGVTFSAATTDGVEKIYVKDDAVYVGMNGVELDITYDATITDLLNYYTVESNVEYSFYVSDGRIVYIEASGYTYTAEGTSATMANVVAAMGEEKYVDSENLYFMADEGVVTFYYEAGAPYKTISGDAVVTKAGNDYYCFDEASGMAFVVEVADGKAVELHLIENGFSNVLRPKNAYSPIGDIEIELPTHGKAIKTVVNGRVVIIRDGEMWDLNGRKL